ncbi:NAD-dependent epimerase/dehydratase family protein [Diaminobutyricimonas sp. LJ205]|uniref:NAD-dependent epimerase/dehydratase family protein n=1 Tax=Diaminobutyricimonas sp. LJ205 TaxID=2683590 RepID=UPI0012F4D2AB|nr:NAD-dependent epimerase/dehydratase family protein [Diaminobutyricimonas sp. LJ205]
MRVLVLGGTQFVGRAVVDEALARGWSVTTFNRGTRPATDRVTALVGDRTAPRGLAALEDGSWDVVVDTWSWAPSVVRDSASLLASRAGRYVYVSSRSVYASPLPAGVGEDAAVVQASPDAGDVEYPEAKAGAELAVVASFGDRAVLARPGVILGPHENVGRLPWWLNRIARGGEVLAPGPAGLGIQYIDARDLASWCLTAGASGLHGAYNIVAPVGHATMGSLLEAAVRMTGSRAVLRWVPPEVILAAGIEPWTDLPIWLPPGELHGSFHESDVTKALAAGLHCRPVEETVADTWAWLQSIGGTPPQREDRPAVGLDPELEQRVLASVSSAS